MRDIRIYSPEPLRTDADIELGAAPTRHIAQVLRRREGETLILFDGSGGEYPAVIRRIEKNRAVVQTAAHDPVEREAPLAITLWHGICRGERMDTVVQKATELGVLTIRPLLTERAVVKLDASRTARKLEHWRRIAISACEQCGRNRIPTILPPAALTDCLNDCPTDTADFDARLILHPGAGHSLAAAGLGRDARVVLCTGPEGGFTDAEVAAADRGGFRAVGLGPRVLRTETAPVAAIAALQALYGDLA